MSPSVNVATNAYNAQNWVEQNSAFVAALRSGGSLGRSATYVVAASDAPAHVKAQADYVCDGTADNVEIQAAIDALDADGGLIKLSSGTFVLSAQITNGTKRCLSIEGEGMGGGRNNAAGQTQAITSLDVASGLNNDIINLNSSASIITLRDFRTNCNSAGQSAGSGIYSQAWYLILDNIWVDGAKEHGIELEGAGAIPASGTARNVWTSNNTQNGWYFANNASDWDLLGLKSFQNGTSGIQIYDGGYNRIIGGDFYSNTSFGIAIRSRNATHTRIIAATINDNTAFGLSIYNFAVGNDPVKLSNSVVRDCVFFGNAGSIKVEKAVNGILIDGNWFSEAALASDQDSGTTGVLITNNQFRSSFGTAPYGAKAHNNYGYVTENSGSSTGTGAQQTIAHGLAATPTKVTLTEYNTGLAVPYESAVADATNIYVLATLNKTYRWKAEV